MSSIIKSDNGVSSGVTGIVQTADSSGQLAFQTTTSGGSAVTALTIDNSQKVTFANTIGFGSNAGITFNNSSALTNSTLNDYETGTWTPSDASGAGLTITFNNAKYVKIGKMVYVSTSTIVYPSTANSSAAVVAGLPFTSTLGEVATGALVSTNTYANRSLIGGNSNAFYFYANASASQSTNAQLSGATIYGWSAVYQATF